ncbi:MAG: ABC transporter permease [Elusimicrobia bacterium]|nr:ABC transporter permease [Elusimicrobiota bacterium]
MTERTLALFDSEAAADAGPKRGFRLVRRCRLDRVGLVGAVLSGLMCVAAIAGPLVAPFDPAGVHPADRLVWPNETYLLGTDELGRDLLSRVLHGSRVSLQVGVTSVSIAGLVGVLMGLAAGFYGGVLDLAVMRVMDVLFAFPIILLALALVAVLGTDLRNLILAITIVYVPTFARIARGSTLVVVAESYIDAARSVGASDGRIIMKHVLPNVGAPIIVQFTINLAYAILVEASLSFLGLGVQPPAPTWGGMLSDGKDYIEISPWVSVVPGLAIMFTVLGLNLLGDGMRDALDPRLRGNEGETTG